MKHNEERTREIESHISGWRGSGQSQTDYCREHGIVPKTFRNWVGRYGGKQAVKSKKARFIAIGQELAPTPVLSIHYPNGTYITCPAGMGIPELRSLLHLLD
jgi:hypothetical protein